MRLEVLNIVLTLWSSGMWWHLFGT